MTLERQVPASEGVTVRSTGASLSTNHSSAAHQDEPINSRNSPSTVRVLSCGSSDVDALKNKVPQSDDMVEIDLTIEDGPESMSVSAPGGVETSGGNPQPSHVDAATTREATPHGRKIGVFDGLFGCLRPVLTFIGRSSPVDLKHRDDWEIKYEDLSDLQFLACGAQGTVFLGKYRGAPVAVKKVRDITEINIRHLRKLSHTNIVTFKGICKESPIYCLVMEYCCYGPL